MARALIISSKSGFAASRRVKTFSIGSPSENAGLREIEIEFAT
jgi:hypothetical protein